MTVAELITLLQAHSPHQRVLVRGYEDGYCDVGQIEPLRIKLNAFHSWYYGPHDSVHPSDEDQRYDEIALFIQGLPNPNDKG